MSPANALPANQAPPEWLRPVVDMLTRVGPAGGFAVRLPEYRPELVRVLADRLGLAFIDVRAEILAPLGPRAAALPLDTLDAFLTERAADVGLVAHNVEALLAAKPADARAGWLGQLLAGTWPQPVVVPLVLFGDALPDDHPRVATIDGAVVPAPTLLMRLLSGR